MFTHKYTFSTYYVLSTVLDAGDTREDRMEAFAGGCAQVRNHNNTM